MSVKQATYRGVEVLSADECRQIVARKLKTEEVEVLEVTTATLGETPAGFLGDHYRVTINASSIGNQPKEFRLFVKTVPNCQSHADFAIKIGAVKKETDFFSVLMPELSKYNADSSEVNDKTVSTWSCECYYVTPTKIVLEDMSAQGFRNHDQRTPMDYDHCVLVLQTLARFHASSIVFEEKETQCTGVACRLNEVYPDQFQETLWINEKGHPCQKLNESGMNCSFPLLKYLPELKGDDKRYEEVVERMLTVYEDICTTTMKPSREIRNVISHGDLWSNNILIRYDSNNNPIEAKFVDFQLLRYLAPAHDLLNFLHLNTRRQLRDKHLLDFALTYHVALRIELARHHLDVEVILPWKKFKSSLTSYRELATLTAIIAFPLIKMSGDVLLEMMSSPAKFDIFMFEDRSTETHHLFETDSTFRELMTEVLEELAEH